MANSPDTRNNQMNRRASARNSTRFQPYMRGKLVVFCVFVVIAIIALTAVLIHITTTSEAQYKKQVLSQQKYDSTTLPFKRGDILDANGTILAHSEKVYNVILDVVVMTYDEEGLEPTLAAIDACFDVDIQKIRSYVEENPNSQYYKIAKLISYEEKVAFESYVEEQERLGIEAAKAKGEKYGGTHIAGIWFEEEYIRQYPYQTLASDIMGFTGKDNLGQFGLEEQYNDVLNGTPGRKYGFLNDDSELKRTIIPAENGHSIISTIDMNIQKIVENVIHKYNEQLRNNHREGAGAENMAVIVMDVNDASVLAMATNRGYDCSNPYDLTSYYTEEQIEEMKTIMVDSNTGEFATEETKEVYRISKYTYELNQLWRNFCLSDTYEPGSVAKPFTVAACLEDGIINGSETYMCDGSLYRGGYDIECHEKAGHGVVTVSYAVQESCNVAMMYMSEKLGAERFSHYQNLFGFGLKTNIDLAGEGRTASLIHTVDSMGVTELATSSFGQGFQVNMIQMAASFSALVNGGNLYQPQMVRKIVDDNGNVVKNIEPMLIKQTISQETSDKIVQYCNATVVDGTGRKGRPVGYDIGGKTGTSETLPRGNGNYVVSFIGYAPADDPQIIVYAVIDRPNVPRQDIATEYACWMARDVLQETLPYLNIFPTRED